MIIERLNSSGSIPRDVLEKTISILKNGGVVLAPSDTCYGLLADIYSRPAIEKVYKLKNRRLGMPFSIFLNFEMLSQYVEINGLQDEKIKQYFPGRFTLVLPKKETVPSYITSGSDNVGVRIIKFPLIEQLIKEFSSPLITTSANLSGKTSKYNVSEILEEVDSSLIDLVLDMGVLANNPPSTVIKVDNFGSEEIFRP